MNSKDNKLIVIIGAGRTGSSMLTRILIALGMTGPENFVEAVEHNPEGVFEDKNIVEMHKEVFSLLKVHPYAPVPENFLDTPGINQLIVKIRNIVKNKISNSESYWGFKDPRTASLLPLWSRVFNPLKISPKYIITVRNPSAVVTSMHRQFNDNQGVAELVWLIRTTDALYYSGGNCFIVHYEDWFTDQAKQLAINMTNFIDLSQENKVQNLDDLLSGLITPSLNRSSYEKHEVKNPFVKKLYAELKNCRGDQFDHERLMKVVIECKQAIKSFSPWVALTSNQPNKNSASIKEIKALKEDNSKLLLAGNGQLKEIKALKEDNSKLLLAGNGQLKEIKELKDGNEDLRIKISFKSNEAKELQKNIQHKTAKTQELQEKNQSIGKTIKILQTKNNNK